MKPLRFAIAGLVLLLLGSAGGYVLVYNWMGQHVAESARVQFLESRKASGHFPVAYRSVSKILGVLPGPQIGYRNLGHDCYLLFSPLLVGQKRELGCVSGEWRTLN